ncbi:Aldehyde dehydrogenase [Grifola frondosa]|uniref:aldehyde dehydrogenase (NAD(+)) n=1 Tax=Grifola frondosa TaxID=5627 RepID=A0A1C7M4V2_GRIFR|nr:Aldehyde dehydrogenase [Grifola frondosa]
MAQPLTVTIPATGKKITIPTGLFINNEFVPSVDSKELIKCINPATEDVICSIVAGACKFVTIYLQDRSSTSRPACLGLCQGAICPISILHVIYIRACDHTMLTILRLGQPGSEKDIDVAVAAARNALNTTWGKNVTPVERARLINKLADLMERDAQELAELETLNNGKPIRIARDFDIGDSVACLRYYAGWADKITGQTIEVDNTKKIAFTRHDPIGVCGQIIPWNYPINMWAWKVAPALACGCTIVMKPSEITPLTSLGYLALDFALAHAKRLNFPQFSAFSFPMLMLRSTPRICLEQGLVFPAMSSISLSTFSATRRSVWFLHEVTSPIGMMLLAPAFALPPCWMLLPFFLRSAIYGDSRVAESSPWDCIVMCPPRSSFTRAPRLWPAWMGSAPLRIFFMNLLQSKVSPLTQLSLFLYVKLSELVVEAGFPPGVINTVPSLGSVGGAALSSHKDVDKVAFTGSTITGRRIMEAAAKSNLKKVSLELGGKSPHIVFESADLDQAANWAALGILYNTGQDCTAGSRLFVQDTIYDKFIQVRLKAGPSCCFGLIIGCDCAQILVGKAKELVVGDGFDEKTSGGPVVSKMQYDKIFSYIEAGKQQGAKVALGGEKRPGKGYFVEPTIFTDVTPDMKIVRDEIFGPVLSVAKFSTEEEVIKLANDTTYGLGAGLHSNDANQCMRVSSALEAGTVWVNQYNMLCNNVPFGGKKQSGIVASPTAISPGWHRVFEEPFAIANGQIACVIVSHRIADAFAEAFPLAS